MHTANDLIMKLMRRYALNICWGWFGKHGTLNPRHSESEARPVCPQRKARASGRTTGCAYPGKPMHATRFQQETLALGRFAVNFRRPVALAIHLELASVGILSRGR